VTESISNAQTAKPRAPVWVWILAGAAVIVLAAAAGGAIVAIRRRGPHVTAVGCIAKNVAANGLPSVVTIHVNAGSASGSGSGEVIKPDGYILTNNHVIAAAAHGGSITVLFNDGESADARLIGRDIPTDLAIVKVDEHPSLRPIPWGKSSSLAVGQPVVALGAPLGLANTVTAGIVSALDRSVNVPADNGRTALLVSAIQTDAAINPGNSGGALVDCNGKLVGVPTAGAAIPNPAGGTSVGNVGIGFAIPSDFARTVSDEIIANGSITHSSFGVRVTPVSSAQSGSQSGGLYVVATSPGGPAAQAGLEGGDIITKLDGDNATSADQLQALTLTRRPGEQVKISFTRAGTEHTTTVTLGRQSQ
jgi:putative serine protease PepD